jgi:hypothetical protein
MPITLNLRTIAVVALCGASVRMLAIRACNPASFRADIRRLAVPLTKADGFPHPDPADCGAFFVTSVIQGKAADFSAFNWRRRAASDGFGPHRYSRHSA